MTRHDMDRVGQIGLDLVHVSLPSGADILLPDPLDTGAPRPRSTELV
jgi:hypothetical protein